MARGRGQSRASRWEEAAGNARTALEALEQAKADLDTFLEELQGIKEEYSDWLDNLPDSLRDSPVGEKLQAMQDLDLEPGDDLDAIRNAIDEAEGADLPLGWGKD